MMKWTARIDGDKVIIEGAGSEESGAIIEVTRNGLICLFEIPQYGGFPREAGTWDSILGAMKEAERWT